MLWCDVIYLLIIIAVGLFNHGNIQNSRAIEIKNRNQYSPLVTIPFKSMTLARNGKIILFPESMGEVPSLIFRDRSLIMWKVEL